MKITSEYDPKTKSTTRFLASLSPSADATSAQINIPSTTMGDVMKIEIIGNGTAMEFQQITEGQYRKWVDQGTAATSQQRAEEGGTCPDVYAVTGVSQARRAGVAGPCPYSSKLYVTFDAADEIEIDLADIVEHHPEDLIHCREAYPDPVPHIQRTLALKGTFYSVELPFDHFVLDKLSIGMTYCYGAFMIDQVRYDGVAIQLQLPDVVSESVEVRAGGTNPS